MSTVHLFMDTTTQGKPLDASGIVIIVLFFAAFIGFVLYAKLAPHRHAQRIATSRKLTYAKRDDSILTGLDTWPFYLGRAHRARDVMTGVFEGANVKLFNFDFQDAQGGLQLGVNGIPITFGGAEKRADTGIFAGADPGLGVVTGRARSRMFDRGSGNLDAWGIGVMEMPRPLPPILVRVSLQHGEVASGVMSNLIGVTNPDDPKIADLSTGDPEFDKWFLVRAEDPSIVPTFLPEPTRAMLLENRKQLTHHALHLWTWDRYLFTLENMPLTENMVAYRLPLMKAVLDNANHP